MTRWPTDKDPTGVFPSLNLCSVFSSVPRPSFFTFRCKHLDHHQPRFIRTEHIRWVIPSRSGDRGASRGAQLSPRPRFLRRDCFVGKQNKHDTAGHLGEYGGQGTRAVRTANVAGRTAQPGLGDIRVPTRPPPRASHAFECTYVQLRNKRLGGRT